MAFQREVGSGVNRATDVRDLLTKMKPDKFNDIIATSALYRPGPLEGGMVMTYVKVKNGLEPIPKVHPIIDEIVEETYGVMVYQEQVMRILNRLGGIELSSAYLCIKTISKKAHAVGAWTYVDAVQSVPHVSTDVQDLDCDFLVCSPYKFFGPHQGALWGKRELLEILEPYKVRPAPTEIPHCFETGTQNHEGMHLELNITVIPVVVSDGHAGLDRTHDLAKALGRGVDYGSDPVSLLIRKTGNLHPLFRGKETFMHHQVGSLGFFQEPLVGCTITAEHKTQPLPVEAEANCAIHDVNGRKTGDLDPVLIVDDGGFAEVKLVGDDLATCIGQHTGAGEHIPCPGSTDVINVGFGPQFRARAGGAIDMEGGIAATYPAAYPKSRNIADMVGV